jgi:xanthine dehydrogenase YagR molybdenum-binding subunit
MAKEINRRGVLNAAAAVAAFGLSRPADTAEAAAAPHADSTTNQRGNAVIPYVGTPTSRVDGRAKVTGAAKYAAEFNHPGLA